MVPQVEVIGRERTCQIGSLPSPLYGLTAGLVGDMVLACGGFHYYYRRQCYEYSPQRKTWQESSIQLENATGFPAGVSDGGKFYVGGGRRWVDGSDPWEFFSALRVLEGRQWNILPDLPEKLADTCFLITGLGGRKRLWVFGGSNVPQRYRTEVYARDLTSPSFSSSSPWVQMPELPDARMWHGCVTADVDGVKGIVVVGGYYNGVTSMFLPLEDNRGSSLEKFGSGRDLPRWEWLSGLTKERKWGPAVGFIGPNLAVAGGGDYGDETVDLLVGSSWVRSEVVMNYKREFSVGVTVPSEWFPECF
eukprot:GFUD01039149.1.p1 GENE.GFUD01039149.1~~GFUD01039149.1.p1  ORF type:complete len:358 (+),score=104.04 GFUD01039149.1:162-1076(+)